MTDILRLKKRDLFLLTLSSLCTTEHSEKSEVRSTTKKESR